MTGQRKKLLYLVTEDWYFASHRLALAIAAREAGYDVGVATRVRRHGSLIRAAGLRLIPFENSRTGLNPLGELWTLCRLILLFLRERPDIAHHVAMKPVLYGSLAGRLARTPRVVNALAGMGWLFVSDGAGMTRYLKPLVRRALGWALSRGTVLVQNPDDARMVVEMGVPARLVRRIAGSGVDLQRFVPHPEPVGVPTVLLCARLLWHKGVGEFAAAAQLLRARGVEARFVLAGEPDLANPSAIAPTQIRDWVNNGTVEYLGWVEDMPGLLARSTIVCLPSYGEGIPKALIEAAAAGRPIVTTDTPGCREAVRDGDNGLLVPPRDPSALADALARLIGDPQMRRQMGSRGRARAEQEFAAERIISQTLALYAEPGD